MAQWPWMLASGAVSGALALGWAWAHGGSRFPRPSATSAVRPAKAAIPGGDPVLDALAAQYASETMMRLDGRGRLSFVAPACRALFGRDATELLGRPLLDLVHPDGHAEVRAHLDGLGPGCPAREATWRGRHRNGAMPWIEAAYRYDSASGGAIAVLRDVTRRRQAEDRLLDARERLERLAATDSLTGLPSRAAFLDAADRLSGADHALVVIDIDRFRSVNDLHGHAAGDAALRKTAAHLTLALAREPMLARLGADEFGALIRAPEGDAGVAARARDLIRVLGEPMRIDTAPPVSATADEPAPVWQTLDLGVSVGVALPPRDGTGAAALLRAAGLALEHAKQAGGGTYRFHEPRMTQALAEAAAHRADLGRALRHAEIVPWFQPVVRLGDGTLAGFEALARWEHPTRGVLEPALFLPLAEETGASADMFAALLGRACAVAARWDGSVGLSVNLSPHELRDETLPDVVARILADSGLDGARLEIEITEHAVIHDSVAARAVLDGLRGLGVSLALDDFGTGFSGLRLLRDVPFDKVKIDRSLTRGLGREGDDDNARFVAAIVALAHALGLELTAEGIEDETALVRLRDLGCTYGQGAVFQSPVPAVLLERTRWQRERPAA